MAKTKKVRKNSSPASERINNQARKSTKTGGTTPQSILTEDRGDWNNKANDENGYCNENFLARHDVKLVRANPYPCDVVQPYRRSARLVGEESTIQCRV